MDSKCWTASKSIELEEENHYDVEKAQSLDKHHVYNHAGLGEEVHEKSR
jgi:hypothetical protein